MPDLALRFNKDILVVARPAKAALKEKGLETDRFQDLALLLEPETVEDALMLDVATGAQCLVAPTADCTPARLAEAGMEDKALEIVQSALRIVRAFKPQHLLAELSPCGLPLDPWNKGSLRENMDQYTRAARLFAGEEFDAFLLSGFESTTDLKCALMGIRKVSDAPIMASVKVAQGGVLADKTTLEEALGVMAEYEANVAGFETELPQQEAVELAQQAKVAMAGFATSLPLMVTLLVEKPCDGHLSSPAENPYHCADTMMAAADALRTAGAQFSRAAGDATPAYTGVLVGATLGLDVVGADGASAEDTPSAEDLAALIASSQARISAALADAGTMSADDDEPFDPSILDGEAPEAVKVSGLFPFLSRDN